MTEPKDPERLLADALRAQAVFAPHTSSQPASTPGDSTGTTDELPPRYGLLSGAGADSLARERAALDDAAGRRTTPAAPDPPTVRQAAPAPAPLPALWVLLLALLLGLAAGSVIGLLTLV
ncbi:hypothetical protein [Amycolatopsis sp. FDAARGOS 1241]|uniref:hypothetical protein n=1 Tax=Amycolatopsis sp. FDAARGOS 1241 TaxID=2778070 RepID=UPI0019511C39|nr:hypothetical protein [Amycolatopsis sp. FDAARGOS 1241]QRP46257.1 hypothetical protein I6J71_45790 [Amycolatopsis sp. FDAARGOS 1241]